MTRQNVVLLGASNLVLGWQALIHSLRDTFADPIDLLVAMGMGRSYLTSSAFFFRQLPGITSCGLWRHLPGNPERPPCVLITDLGNDIVYLFEPDQIAEAVRQCLTRIREWSPEARIVMTGLPLASLASVGRTRFLVARSILFPGCWLPLSTITERAHGLDQLVRQLGEEFGVPIVDPEPQWYGLDPIHVVPKFKQTAFSKYFAALGTSGTIGGGHTPGGSAISLPGPAESTRFGRLKKVPQPTIRSPQFNVSAW